MFAIKIFFWLNFKENVALHYALLEQELKKFAIHRRWKTTWCCFCSVLSKMVIKRKRIHERCVYFKCKNQNIIFNGLSFAAFGYQKFSVYIFLLWLRNCHWLWRHYVWIYARRWYLNNILSRRKMEMHGYSAAWVCRRGSWGTMTVLKFRGN